MPRKQTSHDDLVRVVQLHKIGKKNREISKVTGVNEKTVSRLIQKWKREGGGDNLPEHSRRSGRPLKISVKCLRLIRRQLDIQPTLTAKQLKEKNPKLLAGIAVRTIQDNLNKRLSYSKVRARVKPLVTAKQRRRRVKFARNYRLWGEGRWQRVLWSDESTFCVSDTKGTRVWKSPSASPCDPRLTVQSVKHPPYLMVWGSFGFGGLGSLVVLPKGLTMNSARYIKLLKDHLADSFASSGTEVFQQDGAPCHTSRASITWLANSGVDFIPDWPGQSPDISPIETLWAIMKARLRREDTSTIAKLEVAIRKVWAEIPLETCQRLANSVPQRLRKVIKAKGFPIAK